MWIYHLLHRIDVDVVGPRLVYGPLFCRNWADPSFAILPPRWSNLLRFRLTLPRARPFQIVVGRIGTETLTNLWPVKSPVIYMVWLLAQLGSSKLKSNLCKFSCHLESWTCLNFEN